LHVEDGVGEVEHPLILTGDREIPFTYLACLLAKWTIHKDHASSIQGKIKVISWFKSKTLFDVEVPFHIHRYIKKTNCYYFLNYFTLFPC